MTPQDHRDAAAQLLADVNDAPETPSAQRVLTQAAIAHALLGLLEVQIQRQEVRRPEWMVDLQEHHAIAARAARELAEGTERNAAHGS